MSWDEIERMAEHVLCEAMPDALKAAIDAALAKGARHDEILRRVRAAEGGERTLTVLAVEAYLGARQDGTAGPKRPLPPAGKE